MRGVWMFSGTTRFQVQDLTVWISASIKIQTEKVQGPMLYLPVYSDNMGSITRL